jgi:DNA-binding LacI/PurR family transcriptional regulator
LGYRPSAAGRMLRTGKTHVLGVVMPPPSLHPLNVAFYPHVLQGIAACAAERGYDVLWITNESPGDDVPLHAGVFKSKRVDGLIDVCIFAGDPRIQALRASGQPFVLIGRPDDTSLPHVDVANRAAALHVGREFLRRGYTSVGFIGIKDQPASLDRLAGLQRALAETGRAMLPHHQVLIRHELERSLGLEAFGAQTVHAWMARGEPPRAVLTSTDTIAYGVLRACREVGVRVPMDLALVGFDDEAPSRYLDPPLASVEQPLHELGYETALLLLDLISGEIRQPAEKVLPARLIHRASLGDAPRVDPTPTP